MNKWYTAWLLLMGFQVHTAEITFELSGTNVRDYALTDDGNELYVTMESVAKEASQIIVMHKKQGRWSEPKMASFSGQFKDLEPFLHPNGLQLFFASNRNAEQTQTTGQFDIWYVTRRTVNSPWSEPVKMSDVINTAEGNEFYPSVSSNGNLYFTATKSDGMGKEDIYVSRLVAGEYQAAELLPDTVNSATFEFNAYINPAETMLLFSSYGRPDGMDGGDLYVSHKKDGQWQTAKNLGPEINTNKLDYCPFYDAQSKTLYWTSNYSAIHAENSEPRDFTQWYKLYTEGANGQGKIYSQQVDLTE